MMAAPAGFENKVGFIWRIADKLRGDFKQHEYGAIMLPTLVLFRLDAVLAPTKDAVVARAKQLDLNSPSADPLLRRAAGGLPFYNTSPLDMKAMLSDDKNIAAQLATYVTAFSPEASRVLDAFNYQQTIVKLDRAGVLYQVLGDFADVDLHPKTVSNEAMGYIFEELLRKFSEMSNETAGEHYTPREVIRLMVDLLFDEDTKALTGQAPVRTVYDPAAGTGGMLTIAAQRLKEFNPMATVSVYGQELNPETWAIARSELMMRGENPGQLAPGNSLTDDRFPDTRFDYILANPPYGVDWKKYADPIRRESASSASNNRFAAGLPRISDGSLLFLQHMISKFKPHSAAGGGSRLAIVLSGSPLFSGGAGSGESEIRRWIIENDWLEGIVGLPDQMFYNTGISTYVWIVTNRKPDSRRGTVTLVDARDMGTKMRKSLGDKRKELTGEAITEIARLFVDARDIVDGGQPADPRVKVLRNEEFGFARLTVERPLRRVWGVDVAWPTLTEDVQAKLDGLQGTRWHKESDARPALVKAALDPKQITAFLKVSATSDPGAIPVKAKKGDGFEADADLRDQENIPLPAGYLDMGEAAQEAAIYAAAEAHLKAEIHPYVPDAWIDHTKTRVGYEVPFTRHFYVYTQPRPVAEIRAEIDALEVQIQARMRGLVR